MINPAHIPQMLPGVVYTRPLEGEPLDIMLTMAGSPIRRKLRIIRMGNHGTRLNGDPDTLGLLMGF